MLSNGLFSFQLYEVIENDEYLCLVTARAKTDLLAYICDNGVRSESESRKFARQLVDILEYLHSRDIVHR